MSKMFPTASERTTRRAALYKRLDAFLDNHVPSDGGYAPATDEDVQFMQGVFEEIADLKFGRDPDGDQVLGTVAWNRRRGRMETFFFPHDPSERTLGREPTPLDQITHENQMARATGFMASVLHRHLDRISMESDMRRDAAMKVVDGETFVEAYRVTLARDPIAAEKMLDDEMAKRTPLFDKRGPIHNMMREEFGAVMVEETRVAGMAIDHVLSMLATAHVTDRQIEKEVADTIMPALARFGKATFKDQVERWNSLYNERRRARMLLTTAS
jgi:hypothetical protein